MELQELKELLAKHENDPAAMRRAIEEALLNGIVSKDKTTALSARLTRDIDQIIDRERTRCLTERFPYPDFISTLLSTLGEVLYPTLRTGMRKDADIADIMRLVIVSFFHTFFLQEAKVLLVTSNKSDDEVKLELNALMEKATAKCVTALVNHANAFIET